MTRESAPGVQVLPEGAVRKCSWIRAGQRFGRRTPCNANAVALVGGHLRCPEHLGDGVWIEFGLAWRPAPVQEDEE